MRTYAVLGMARSLEFEAEKRRPQGPADPPLTGSAGLSGEGQLRAPPRGAAAAVNAAATAAAASAATAVAHAGLAASGFTAAFGVSATADCAARKAYRNMP
ncbi:hypothetical protein GCM10010392_30320 [Streptomyces clavifer]|nr:hypothetical protein GCM10010392_30320 [Streptomyces clavifer]